MTMKECLFVAAIILGIVAMFMILSAIMSYGRKKKIRGRMRFYYGRRRDIEYSDEVLSVIGEYARMKDGMIDEITWNDLDMDDLFQQMNHTWSFAGEDYLYYLLHIPQISDEEWNDREDLITYYQEHEDERIELQMIFAGIGKYHGSSIYRYIRESIELNTKTPFVDYACLAFLIIAVINTIVDPLNGVGVLILCIITNIGLYFYKRKALENAMQALQYFLKLWNGAGQILKKRCVPDEVYTVRLKEDYDCLKKKLGSTSMLKPPDWGNQSLTEMLLDYVRLFTHLDNIFFYRCMRRLNKDIEVVENIITTMGFLESMIAIGSFRSSLPYYSIPEFGEEEGLTLKNAYHPLIEDPVANSVHTSRGVLLTGSNASGKSTFLKTVAINAILAQGIHTCAAEHYKGRRYWILSSMALRDSLYRGESYYITEIKALKRVLDAGETGLPVLCFVDEVLRGTNTVERIAASSQVLKRFCEKGILCFAATHDIELTYLLEEFYENYHFQEQVIDGEIVFDYCLYEGRSNSRNAIRLLEILGYDKDIIDGAERMVSGFLENGKWS